MRISTIGNCGRRACQYLQRRSRAFLLIVLTIVPAFTHASANQTVQLLVNTPAGGTLDGLGRRLAAAMSAGGIPAEIRNVPGNGGMIGAVKLLEEPADGRTLLLTSAFPLGLASGVGDGFPYNPLADFVPVAPIASAPLVVIVPSSSRYGKISDLISAAKSKNLMLGTTGHGPTSIAGTLFSKGTGGKVEQVPYRGIGSVLADLTSGNGLDFTIADLASVRTLLESGKLRVLAVTGKARHPALPEIPTLAESGVPGVDISAWAAVMVRAGTPDDIVNALSRHIERAMSADAELKKYLDSIGTAPWTGGGAAVTEAIRLDMHSSSMASAAGYPRVAYSMPAARSQVASAPAPAFPAVAASPPVTPTTRPSSVREEEDVPKVPTPFEVIMGIAGAVNEGRRQADERTAQWARQREEEARKWGEQASRAAAERERQAQLERERQQMHRQTTPSAPPSVASNNYPSIASTENAPPAANSSPSAPRDDGVNASHCLRVGHENNGGNTFMYNSCNVSVKYTYCYINNDQLFGCGPFTTTYGGLRVYGRGSSGVPAGGKSTMPGTTSRVAFFGCSAGPSGIPPIPFLTSYDPPRGVCR